MGNNGHMFKGPGGQWWSKPPKVKLTQVVKATFESHDGTGYTRTIDMGNAIERREFAMEAQDALRCGWSVKTEEVKG